MHTTLEKRQNWLPFSHKGGGYTPSIFDLFRARTQEGEQLRLSWRKKTKQKICWYPASGGDFRDIVYSSPERCERYQIPKPPDVYVHTDYMYYNRIDPSNFEEGEFLYKSDKTQVQILKRWECDPFSIPAPTRTDLVRFDDIPIPETNIYFLVLSVTSHVDSERIVPLLYFQWENYDFFEKVVVAKRIPIYMFFRFNEGLGFGGGRVSICPIFRYFANMGVQFAFLQNDYRDDWEGNIETKRIVGERRAIPYRLQPRMRNLFQGSLNLFQILPGDVFQEFAEEDYLEEMDQLGIFPT